MPNIGLLSPFPPEKDGIAIYSDNLIRGFGKKSRQIVKIGRSKSKAPYHMDFASLSLKAKLKKIIRKEKLGGLHIQYVPTLFGKYSLNYSLLRAIKLPIPVIVTLHEVHYSDKGLRNWILSHIQKKIIKGSNKIIVHTPKQKEFLSKKYNTTKINTIYHGLRLNKIPKREMRKHILCFGMISHGKGIPYLIRAMRYLPEFKLTIAGGFVDRTTRKEVLEALKKSKAKIKTVFHWIGEKEKEKYFREANCVILPHIWAPYQSGILHNAVAWGLPVVVTKTGALHEMVELFHFGEVVQPKSPRALAQGIRKVFKEHKKYQGGIKNYRAAANWKIIAAEHLKLYQNA
jgi:glycosyltransferase involved in cell wall biosynthesis